MDASGSCYVNKKLYPHLLLIPAIIIVSFLAFLNKRRSFRIDILGGRPGLVIPVDILGVDHDRLATSAIFAVSVGWILKLVISLNDQSHESKWVAAFVAVGYVLEIAMLFYPFFGCLTTEHRLIGSTMGLLYTFMWFVLDMLNSFDKCLASSLLAPKLVISIPLIICYLFLLGKFSIVLYIEGKRFISWHKESEHADVNNAGSRKSLTKPWLIQHVKDVLKPKPYIPEERWIRFLRSIYSPKSNFLFSMQTVSVVVVCCIVLFTLTVIFIHFGRTFIESESLNPGMCNTNMLNAFGSSIVASAFFVALVCAFSIVRFMECHKNNMSRMFKGDTSFLPKGFEKSQLMVGKCLKYAGYHIGYFVWGYLLLMLVFTLFTIFLHLYFHCGKIIWISTIIPAYFTSFLCITLPLWMFLFVASMTIFRDEYFKKEAITIDNRNFYLVCSYFLFFLTLPMGIFSAILRVLKAAAVGFFMLPRVDRCVMPDGFQKFDNGFAAYVCYLHVQAAHRNPVLRVFCQIVHDEMRETRQSDDGTLKRAKRYRNKWLLLVTLIRNPQLQGCRKHVIAPPVLRFVNDVDISVEIPNFEEKM